MIGQTYRKKDMQMVEQSDWWTGTQKGGQTDRWSNRESDGQTHIKVGAQRDG
jgi:hypothetical protein